MESNTTVETCIHYCNQNDTVPPTIKFCPPPCLRICPSTCRHTLSSTSLPPAPPTLHHHYSPLLLVLLPSLFILATLCAICFTLRTRSPRRVSAVGLDDHDRTAEVERVCACAVCLLHFVGGEELRVLPTCNHVFHAHCIRTWVRSHITCPVCRRSINLTPHHAALEETLGVTTQNKPGLDS